MDIAGTNVRFYRPLHFDLGRPGIPNAEEQRRWSESRKREAVSVFRPEMHRGIRLPAKTCERPHRPRGALRQADLRFSRFRIVTDLDLDLRNEITVLRLFEFWLYSIRLRLRAVDLARIRAIGESIEIVARRLIGVLFIFLALGSGGSSTETL